MPRASASRHDSLEKTSEPQLTTATQTTLQDLTLIEFHWNEQTRSKASECHIKLRLDTGLWIARTDRVVRVVGLLGSTRLRGSRQANVRVWSHSQTTLAHIRLQGASKEDCGHSRTHQSTVLYVNDDASPVRHTTTARHLNVATNTDSGQSQVDKVHEGHLTTDS